MIGLVKWILIPFSLLYGSIQWLRSVCFRMGILEQKRYSLPIVSVGNLAVGGTGKTPHVKYLLNLLQPTYKLAVLSRGYGRNTKGFIELGDSESPVAVGDEPVEIKKAYPNVVVAVCEKRVEGIDNILKMHPSINCILLDDAYQHQYVKPSISLLLSDSNKPFFKDFPMPTGRLREFRFAYKRASAIVLTKNINLGGPSSFKTKLPIFYSSLQYLELNQKFGRKTSLKNSVFVTGIANPKPAENYLIKNYSLNRTKYFKDHYNYQLKDLNKLANDYPETSFIVTAKDWVKWEPILQNNKLDMPVFVLEVEVSFTESSFDNYILNHLKNWKHEESKT